MAESHNPLPITPLAGGHDRSGFQSGAEEFDRYLREQASQDVRRHIMTTFGALDRDVVVGYYTLSAAAIELMSLPDAIVRRLPRHPTIPATLIDRLVVDHPGRDEAWVGTY